MCRAVWRSCVAIGVGIIAIPPQLLGAARMQPHWVNGTVHFDEALLSLPTAFILTRMKAPKICCRVLGQERLGLAVEAFIKLGFADNVI